ncbi:unnamed protein product [Darwinula stevensoni]|uniref:Gustatory receptor n=1 Tax=Darwinula stevensoni TaxID=69355 RepID=A0A7R8XHD7_9CRUS|nr:unnamed protein product [Darwinula stevensoni]CAG0892671.1 unnamed protein product [Darwinula stevensoni]
MRALQFTLFEHQLQVDFNWVRRECKAFLRNARARQDQTQLLRKIEERNITPRAILQGRKAPHLLQSHRNNGDLLAALKHAASSVHVIMYAEDLVMSSTNRVELQRTIEALKILTNDNKMTVNLTNAKAIKFRKGGRRCKADIPFIFGNDLIGLEKAFDIGATEVGRGGEPKAGDHTQPDHPLLSKAEMRSLVREIGPHPFTAPGCLHDSSLLLCLLLYSTYLNAVQYLRLLMERCGGRDIALTGAGLFSLTRPFLISVFAAVCTFTIVCVQLADQAKCTESKRVEAMYRIWEVAVRLPRNSIQFGWRVGRTGNLALQSPGHAHLRGRLDDIFGFTTYNFYSLFIACFFYVSECKTNDLRSLVQSHRNLEAEIAAFGIHHVPGADGVIDMTQDLLSLLILFFYPDAISNLIDHILRIVCIQHPHPRNVFKLLFLTSRILIVTYGLVEVSEEAHRPVPWIYSRLKHDPNNPHLRLLVEKLQASRIAFCGAGIFYTTRSLFAMVFGIICTFTIVGIQFKPPV